MDSLTSLLNVLNLRAKLIYSGGVCGHWLIDHHSDTSIWFHLACKGKGWVHSASWPTPLALSKGDLILLMPQAEKHFLSYSATDLPSQMEETQQTSWSEGDAGFVCGEIVLNTPKSTLWRALPDICVIRKDRAGGQLGRLIELMTCEASEQRLGSDSVVERLCDSLFVLVVRHCIEENLVQKGVFAALQDKRLATVLNLIHQQPFEPWSITTLCSQSGLSKTVLSEKFSTLIGQSPIEYLLFWRLQVAALWLQEPNMTIERVAERCGYESAAAFSKAFKRHFKVSPGQFKSKTDNA